jgi:methylmalonyl-CoA/ethylmalonyl-CoA epimerase
MARLRHIAIIVPDPEKAAKFFEEAFDMKRVGTARRGIHMSDGVINVALLKKEEHRSLSDCITGMWVDDLEAAEKKSLRLAGPTCLDGQHPSHFTKQNIATPPVSCSTSPHRVGGSSKDVVPKS